MNSFITVPVADCAFIVNGIRATGWQHGTLVLDTEVQSTHFIYTQELAFLDTVSYGSFTLKPGMWASVPGHCQVSGGKGLTISIYNYKGVFSLGMSEETGRLRYIDGCSDSLLIPPIKLGEPCLNALYFPPHCKQSQHTHTSLRLGLVIKGEGVCNASGKLTPLRVGDVFYLEAGFIHSFNTESQPMSVIAFHPDSEYGPTDEQHPMIISTIINGISAAKTAAASVPV